MFDLLKSLPRANSQSDKPTKPRFDLIREAAGIQAQFIPGNEYFREHDYEVGTWWSKDHKVFYGMKLPFKTKTGVPDAEAKTFNGFDTYFKK